MAGIQFSGLASGLDTDSIVKAMLATQQSRIDRATQEKTTLQWKKEAWASTNEKLNKFYSDYVSKLRLESTFQSYSSTSSSSAVSVINQGNMPVGIHKIEVIKLATGISKVGDIVADIDDKNKSFKELNLLKDGETSTLKVNDIAISITAEDTLATLEKKIKEADETLNVNFDIKNKKLFVSSKEIGTKAKLNIDASEDSTALFSKLGISEDGSSPGKTSICGTSNSITEHGTGATYKYNGVKLDSDSNNIEVNGLKLTLNEENTGVATIEVKNDPDKIVDFISGFVEAYNELIADLNKQYSASSVSKTPLTDAQKESMTDKQIEEYEKSIKDSLLRRDSSLKTIIDTLRSSMQNVVKGNTFGSLSNVGITTGEYSENGKLKIDTDKLKSALEKDSAAVRDLFTSSGEKYEILEDGKTIQKVKQDTVGIAGRLNTSFQNLSKRIEGVKSYQSFYNDKTNEDKIKSAAERISELETKYKKLETMYYKKFTAMEKAMSTLNSQSSIVSSWLN